MTYLANHTTWSGIRRKKSSTFNSYLPTSRIMWCLPTSHAKLSTLCKAIAQVAPYTHTINQLTSCFAPSPHVGGTPAHDVLEQASHVSFAHHCTCPIFFVSYPHSLQQVSSSLAWFLSCVLAFRHHIPVPQLCWSMCSHRRPMCRPQQLPPVSGSSFHVLISPSYHSSSPYGGATPIYCCITASNHTQSSFGLLPLHIHYIYWLDSKTGTTTYLGSEFVSLLLHSCKWVDKWVASLSF